MDVWSAYDTESKHVKQDRNLFRGVTKLNITDTYKYKGYIHFNTIFTPWPSVVDCLDK